MDKLKLTSTGKAVLFAVVVAAGLLAAGCETVKGFASGVGSTLEGAGKDGYNLWNFIKHADAWVDKNLW
jgi:predicted small secreted protein